MACTTHTIPPIYPGDDMTPPTNWVSKLTVFQLDKIAGAGFPIYTMLAGTKDMAVQDVKERAILDGIEFDDFVFAMRTFFMMCANEYIKTNTDDKAAASFPSGVIPPPVRESNSEGSPSVNQKQ